MSLEEEKNCKDELQVNTETHCELTMPTFMPLKSNFGFFFLYLQHVE